MHKIGLGLSLGFWLFAFGAAFAAPLHTLGPTSLSTTLPTEQVVMKFCGGASGRCYRKCDSNPDLSKRICHCYCKQDDGTIWTKW
jgi:hypothetical protein